MCPHVETDTRGSSKTLVRHTCKACLKVILELPRNETAVRARTAKDVSRTDTSQFRDISRAMHVRPQMTLNAREVNPVLGLLTRNAHVHLSRFSSISGTDFVSLLDDASESILDPTETVTARDTRTRLGVHHHQLWRSVGCHFLHRKSTGMILSELVSVQQTQISWDSAQMCKKDDQ